MYPGRLKLTPFLTQEANPVSAAFTLIFLTAQAAEKFLMEAAHADRNLSLDVKTGNFRRLQRWHDQ
jgi:hypothetical protein